MYILSREACIGVHIPVSSTDNELHPTLAAPKHGGWLQPSLTPLLSYYIVAYQLDKGWQRTQEAGIDVVSMIKDHKEHYCWTQSSVDT
jgi:hypothetical protein